MIQITTDRLILRTITPAMMAAIFDGSLEGKYGLIVSEEWLDEKGKDLQDFQKIMDEQAAHDGYLMWLMAEQESGIIVGDLGFIGRPDNDGAVEMGYGIAKKWHGQGYATEAVEALIGWAMLQESIDTVRARCLPDNAASVRVMEKNGMICVGEKEGHLHYEIRK